MPFVPRREGRTGYWPSVRIWPVLNSRIDESQLMQRILLGLTQLAFIAKILIYFAGLEDAQRHWVRVVVYVVLIAVIVTGFQRYFGESVASFFVMTHT